MADKKLTAAQERLIAITKEFEPLQIDEWLAFIATKNEAEQHDYKVCARRALTVKKMKQYIVKHDNTTAAKAAFDKVSKVDYVVKKTGETKQKDDIVKAIAYFIEKYIPELKVEPKRKAAAFTEEVEGW